MAACPKIWVAGNAYKLRIVTASGVQIREVDIVTMRSKLSLAKGASRIEPTLASPGRPA